MRTVQWEQADGLMSMYTQSTESAAICANLFYSLASTQRWGLALEACI